MYSKREPTPEDLLIRQSFLALQTPRDVATLLQLEYSKLTYYIYRSVPTTRYREFSIPKSSGGNRTILSPNPALMAVQRRLNSILQVVYKPKPSSRGFVQGSSILSNALPHVRRAYVLNVDIENFFPSINFGRVRGMFMAKPYLLNSHVATVLAQICCHNNHLPQGAPTSPVLSNMICAKLDSELQRLARKHRCYYTRYADDITFSTNRLPFPGALALRQGESPDDKVTLGVELAGAIEGNGFRINYEKVRLQSRSRCQQVTGITVNRLPNVRRSFIRKTRGMLHAWEKWGLGKAEEEFHSHYDLKHRNPAVEHVPFKEVVHGRLTYLKMVKGSSDPVYAKLRERYDRLDPRFKDIPIRSSYDRILDSTWVLESEEEMTQGTAFALRNYGLITCSHVIAPNTVAFRPREHYQKYPIRVVAENKDIDIAIIAIDAQITDILEPDMNTSLTIMQEVLLAGFPNYQLGDTGHIARGNIGSFRQVSGITRFLITAGIVAGNSGGPVLDREGKVIGIAVTGSDTWGNITNTEKHGVIPITALRFLKQDPETPSES